MTIPQFTTYPSRQSPGTFSNDGDTFLSEMSAFITATNAVAVALNLLSTTSNSTTSVAIGTGSKSLTVDISKSYQPGMSVKIAQTSSPSNWMHGDVTTYNPTTGALVANITSISGSGTITDWTITLSAPTGMPASAAESDFILAGPSPFAWIKKTLAQTKTILGLLLTQTAEAVGFTISGGTTSKTLTVSDTMTLALGSANYKMFMNAAGTALEWASGSAVKAWTYDPSLGTNFQITDIGFKPSKAVIMATMNGVAVASIALVTAAGSVAMYYNNADNTFSQNANYTTYLAFTASSSYTALVSFDSDGATFSRGKTGTPSTTVNCIGLFSR